MEGRRHSPAAEPSWLATERADALALARRIVGRQDAEDVVQEAITRVLAASGRGAEIDQPRAYLHAAVRNVAADKLRDGQREALPGELPERPGQLADPVAAAELAELISALRELPPRQRGALLATVLTAEDHRHLAPLLGTTPAGVRQLVRRARQRLRDAAGAWIPWGSARLSDLFSTIGSDPVTHGAAALVVGAALILAPRVPHPPAPRPPALRVAHTIAVPRHPHVPTPPGPQSPA